MYGKNLHSCMIRSFRHKGLSELWAKGASAKVDRKLQDRILLRLDALDAAAEAVDMNVPGFDFHALRGPKPTRYTVHVNGPWCLTFEFAEGDAIKVDLEQYH
jgi:proteic killer suppression protein